MLHRSLPPLTMPGMLVIQCPVMVAYLHSHTRNTPIMMMMGNEHKRKQ